jgi:hypothetical protein
MFITPFDPKKLSDEPFYKKNLTFYFSSTWSPNVMHFPPCAWHPSGHTFLLLRVPPFLPFFPELSPKKETLESTTEHLLAVVSLAPTTP